MSNYDPADPNRIILKFPAVGLDWKAEVLLRYRKDTEVTVILVKMEPSIRIRIDFTIAYEELGKAENSYIHLERLIIHKTMEVLLSEYAEGSFERRKKEGIN